MRIGVNTFQLHREITGSGRYAKNLLRALADIDHENEYILFLRKDNASYYRMNRENFVNVVTKVTRRIRPRRIISEQFLLPRLARQHNVDVFWSPSDIAPLRLPCISIVTIHDLKRFVMPHEFPFFERIYFQSFLKRTARRANLIFTGSESSGRDIIKYLGVPPERIIVAHYGLDPDIVEEEGVPYESLKRIHGISRKYIVFVGRMIKSKNVPRMLRAFAACPEAADYEFVLVGQPAAGSPEIEHTIKKGPISDRLKGRVRQIRWVPQEQFVALYKNATALFYVSLYEGFGFPILEAMCCGIPTITSNCASMPEVAGDAALIVDPMDEKAMSETLGKILTDESLRKELIRRGYERVKLFSWKNTAKKYLAVFDRLKNSL